MTATEVTDLRKSLKVSRAVLARFLGVSEMTVIRWEKAAQVPQGLPLLTLYALSKAIQRSTVVQVRGYVREMASVHHGMAIHCVFSTAYGAAA